MKRLSLLSRTSPSRRVGPALMVAVGVGFGAVACGGPAGRPPAAPAAGVVATEPSQAPALSTATQTVEGGQVTVVVTWTGPDAGPTFKVVMDTHAVDLDGYDLRQLARLRTGRGELIEPIEWTAPKGGHHREGSLRFPATTPSGRPVFAPDDRSLELVIRDVAGIPERTYRWTF